VDRGFSKAAAEAGVKITLEADLKKIVALTGCKSAEALGLVGRFARPYIWTALSEKTAVGRANFQN
jgi:hypothetical protein